MDGWIWHQSDFSRMGEVVAQWNAAVRDGKYKPYGYGAFFDLDKNLNAPLRAGRGIVAGRRALIDLLKRQQDQGVSHVAFNPKIASRPFTEVMDELAEHVLPRFSVG